MNIPSDNTKKLIHNILQQLKSININISSIKPNKDSITIKFSNSSTVEFFSNYTIVNNSTVFSINQHNIKEFIQMIKG